MTPRPRQQPIPLDFALLCGAIEELPVGVATTRNRTILYANATLEHIYGAEQGAIEGRRIETLFDPEVFEKILAVLQRDRVFDGRLRLRALDGREFHAEVYAERYTSELAGVGGFLLVREVSLELGTLGRLVDQLGAALFRVRIHDGAVEHASPAVARLLGIDPHALMEGSLKLTDLVAPAERERLNLIYRRLAQGDAKTATASVAVRDARGEQIVLQVVATGNRDAGGNVRYIEGVAMHGAPTRASAMPPSPAAPKGIVRVPSGRDVGGRPVDVSNAVMDLSRELLRESGRVLRGGVIEAEALRRAITPSVKRPHGEQSSAQIPSPTALGVRVGRLEAALAAAEEVNRRVRLALSPRPPRRARIGEVLQGVCSNLAKLLGASSVNEAIAGGGTVLELRFDELHLALVYVGLRTFRQAGGGKLEIGSRLAISRAGSGYDVLVEIVATAAAALEETADEEAQESSQTSPASDHKADAALHTLLDAAGASLEADSGSTPAVRASIRIPLGP